ncbi:MAG: acyl--CoA ligase [Deltaproteobacteria bacterium]|nr:MAG: acyl--CoA ligase [Deltaproteobacteria bacterium]
MSAARTLRDLLRSAAREAPGAEAFRYRDERLTYRDWDALADRLAAGLRTRGVERGTVVTLLLPSTPLYLVGYLAAAGLGAVTTGLNVRYRRSEIRHVLRQSGARLLLAVDRWHDVDFRPIIESVRDELPELARVLWLDAGELRRSTAGVVAALTGEAAPPPPVAIDPADPVAIVFTSGTTGAPKGAWYTHASLLAVADIEARRHPEGVPRFEKHLAPGLSFAHVGTMTRIAVQIANLGVSLIHDTFDPAAVLAAIERERLTHLGGIPTQLVALLDHPDRPRRDLSSLRTVLVGGAPAPPPLVRRLRDELGAEVSVRYSSTEVGIATASVPGDPPDLVATTVGCATPGVELRIVDDANRPRPAGTTGEVVGHLDAAGHLHLTGRRSEMYIRGGFNVHPAEVEERLAQHPKVARAAVVGVPHRLLGEVGWAFVVPRDPAEPPTLAELRAFVGAELASFKRPDGLTLLDDVPLTPMFKVDRRALRTLMEDAPSPTQA